MKELKTYKQFVNEAKKYKRPPPNSLERIANKAITKKDFDKRDISHYRAELIYQLKNDLGFSEDDKISFVKLPSHPKFDQLEDKFKDVIFAMTGTGRSLNARFVKEFVAGFKGFPDLGQGGGDNPNPDDLIVSAIRFQEQLKSGNYPTTYDLMPYPVRRGLVEIMPGSEMAKKLDDKEKDFLKKIVKPKYERFIKQQLTDQKFEKAMKFNLERYIRDEHSDEGRVLGINFINQMPKFFDYVKKLMSLNKRIKWDSFKVTEYKQIGSEHSAVVSSSFSTYYYYDIDISFMGKKFKLKKVLGGSDYYSGGWN